MHVLLSTKWIRQSPSAAPHEKSRFGYLERGRIWSRRTVFMAAVFELWAKRRRRTYHCRRRQLCRDSECDEGCGNSGRLDYESEQHTDVGGIWDNAAVYFPWVRRSWSELTANEVGMPLPPKRVGLVDYLVGKQLNLYTVASGAEVNRGLQGRRGPYNLGPR